MPPIVKLRPAIQTQSSICNISPESIFWRTRWYLCHKDGRLGEDRVFYADWRFLDRAAEVLAHSSLTRREETRESRGMPCLFLNTERDFGGKPPKKSGFCRHLAGSKMPKETFLRRSPVGEWSRGARSMPRVFGRGSRSQAAALVSDRDDAALFPAIRILERYGSQNQVERAA